MMGTSIEDSIKYFTAMMKTCQADSEKLSIAIETMRKYQKIQEIINEYDAAWELQKIPHLEPDNCGNYVAMHPTINYQTYIASDTESEVK